MKRVYDAPEPSDGFRVLVDRLWPRGLSKEKANVAVWIKEIAPSTELRKWFDHDEEKFTEFSQRYRTELDSNDAVKGLEELLKKHETVTLVYAAKDPGINHVAVLVDYMLQH